MYKIIDRFRSDQQEQVDCQLIGSIPSWLHGSLYLNGPGKFQFGPDTFKTLFDGMAVVQQFVIREGSIRYRNRLLNSRTCKQNTAANRIVVNEIGTLPSLDMDKSFFPRYFSYFLDFVRNPTDNSVVSIMPIGDQLFAMTETPLINEISESNLEVIQRVDMTSYLPIQILTAHPLKDSDGSLWNFGTSFFPRSKYCLMKMTKTSVESQNPFASASKVCEIKARWGLTPGYYHSFGMSEEYVVLIEQTLSLPLLQLASAPIRQKSFLQLMKDYPDEKCIFHVCNKRTGSVLSSKYTSSSFLVLHHVNTYEEDGHLVVDVCAYTDTSIFESLKIEHIFKMAAEPISAPEIWRFALPLEKQEVVSGQNLVTLSGCSALAVAQEDGSIFCTPQQFSQANIEMPNINPLVAGRKYRFVYGLKEGDRSTTELMKFDVETSECKSWRQSGFLPVEPVFVPRPDAEKEDDGCLLVLVISVLDDHPSFLLLLDATTMIEICRAEIPIEVKVPYVFHGTFKSL